MKSAEQCLAEGHMHAAPDVAIDETFSMALAGAVLEQQLVGVDAGVARMPDSPLECVSMGVRAALILARYFPEIASKAAFEAMARATIGIVVQGTPDLVTPTLDADPEHLRCANARLIERAGEIAAELRAEEARRCRVCGCGNAAACDGGCEWVEQDLCSKCDLRGRGRAD